MPPLDREKTIMPIRVGLIGYGLAGACFHAPLLAAVAEMQLTAIATSRLEAVRLRGGARCVADPLAVCTAADVDLVVIATPNESHYPLAHAALTAGKHVVVDKPFALSGAAARSLVALARARAAVFGVFHNRRLDGDFLEVRRLLAGRHLGEVLLLESRWDRFKKTPGSGWRTGSGPGSGLLWDLGPHLVDQALQLFGPPDDWTSDIAAQRSAGGSDDYFELTLKYGAMRCILSASTQVAEPRPRFAVHGTGGSFASCGVDPYEAALRGGDLPGSAGFRDRLPRIQAHETDIDGTRRPRAIDAGRWEDFYPEVAAAIRTGCAASSAAEHAVATIELLEAAHAG